MSVRVAIYQSLNNIYKNNAFSNLEINRVLKKGELSSLDGSLYTNIVYGVLQNSAFLDFCIKQFAPNHKLTAKVKTLLKMSYYQMYYMDKIPVYAIVNEAVEIAKQDLGPGAAKFVNAVLHTMAEQPFELKKENYSDDDDYYALLYSIPNWLYKMVVKHYGSSAALQWAQSSKLPPKLYCRVNTLKTCQTEVLQNADFQAAEEVANCLVYLGKGSLASTKEYQEGFITIQDISAQMVAPLLDLQEQDVVLDMCAAPGSKTTQMTALMNNKGKIIATDISAARLELIQQALLRLAVSNVQCLLADALQLKERFGAGYFDKILLDAPCSGFGVIRRKPDIIIQKTKQTDLDGLLELQKQLLEVAYYLLKKGGILVYSTCTLNKKENAKQIASFVVKHSEMRLEKEQQILPTSSSGDGFYMAKLSKE